MLNKHGLKIVGVKKLAGELQYLKGNSSVYEEIFYDMSDGEIWSVSHVGFGNFWTQYYSNSIIKVCTTRSPMTMQKICDKVKYAVNDYKKYSKYSY